MNGMLYDEIELDRLDWFVKARGWWIQQKLDGIRVIMHVAWNGRDTVVRPLARNGDPLRSTTALPVANRTAALLAESVTEMLTGVEDRPAEMWLDGEIVAGVYHAFDLVTGVDREPMWRRLERLQNTAPHLGIQVVATARTEKTKRELVEAVRTSGAEGVVLKQIDAPYVSGRTDQVLKAKFVRSCDAVVTARNVGGRNNAELAMLAGGEYRTVGMTSMIGKPDARPGQVVEVRYLYATDDLRLYQPRLERIRDDKAPEECTIDQLTPTSRDLIEVAP